MQQLASLIVIAILLLSVRPTRAASEAVIDFEGLAEGMIVSSVSSGNGISGDPVSGYVGVFGDTPVFGSEVNAAMIFDARCLPGGVPASCTGQDGDLYNPEFGNTLIISEDLDSSDPDDADVLGAVFHFDYRTWGPGQVTVSSLTVQDVEEEERQDAKIKLYADGIDGTLIAEVDIPETGDGISLPIDVNVSGVGTMLVDLQGSGTIDNIRISTEPTAVTLVDFWVEGVDRLQVDLAWTTAAEVDNYGFNLYRSRDLDRNHATPIHFEPAQGGSGGHTYRFTDTVPSAGNYYYYWLADVDTHGLETFHGPIGAEVILDTPNQTFLIFMPLSVLQPSP
jgi:hypothetical protein